MKEIHGRNFANRDATGSLDLRARSLEIADHITIIIKWIRIQGAVLTSPVAYCVVESLFREARLLLIEVFRPSSKTRALSPRLSAER